MQMLHCLTMFKILDGEGNVAFFVCLGEGSQGFPKISKKSFGDKQKDFVVLIFIFLEKKKSKAHASSPLNSDNICLSLYITLCIRRDVYFRVIIKQSMPK